MDQGKWKAIGDQLLESVKDRFPSHTEYGSTIDHGRYAYLANIHWKLNTDKNRPNKTSRIILIVISGEAIEDSDYDKRCNLVQERFKKFISEKMKYFNAEHGESYGKVPPVEEWYVDTGTLNF
jgi:hypothetical protein